MNTTLSNSLNASTGKASTGRQFIVTPPEIKPVPSIPTETQKKIADIQTALENGDKVLFNYSLCLVHTVFDNATPISQHGKWLTQHKTTSKSFFVDSIEEREIIHEGLQEYIHENGMSQFYFCDWNEQGTDPDTDLFVYSFAPQEIPATRANPTTMPTEQMSMEL